MRKKLYVIELVASGRVCAEARYVGLGLAPWDGVTGPTHRERLTGATFAADMGGFAPLNLVYLFYSCNSLASVAGPSNLANVSSVRYAFSSCAVAEPDFRRFDPSGLTDLFHCLSGCSSPTTIYADASWELPSSGVSGMQCFYSCRSLVGGNGTAWSSSNTGYQYMRIDKAGTPGYLTAG